MFKTSKNITVPFVTAVSGFIYLLNLTLSSHFKTTLVPKLAALPLARPAVPLMTF